MRKCYSNPWITEEALTILRAQTGRILDVGGGAAPYCRASHVLDIQPFDAERLAGNAWNGGESQPRRTWVPEEYTQLDLCSGKAWPFSDQAFDLGLCSHCLEDLRDPLPAVRELGRVCRRLLIIAPSRLLEQTQGIEHPCYCGFPHHPWIVFARDGQLVFRRKTLILPFPACHLCLPWGQTLRREAGVFFYCGSPLEPQEQVFWNDQEDFEDYRRFIDPFRGRQDLLEPDPRRWQWGYQLWRLRQRWQGRP